MLPNIRPTTRVIVFFLSIILGNMLFGEVQAQSSVTGTAKFELEVGSPEAAATLKELWERNPKIRNQINDLRKEMGSLDYGDVVIVEIDIFDGEASSINWREVAAGVGLGLAAAVAWQWFGGEILCAVGVVPACACVGPQC